MSPRWREDTQAWHTDATVRLPSGKTKRLREKSPINTKAACAQHEQALIRAALESDASGRKGPAPKFAAFVARVYLGSYVPANNRQGTADLVERTCRLHLVPFFGRLALDQIGAEQIDAYKASKTGGVGPLTLTSHLAILRRILSLAVEYGRLAKAPKIKAPRAVQRPLEFFTVSEAARLLAWTKDAPSAQDRRWFPVLLVALGAGLRVGELRGLRFGDFDTERRRLQVQRQITGGRVESPKGGSPRTLPISAEVCETVSALRAERRAGLGAWVLPGRGLPVFSDSALRSALARIGPRAGLRAMHPHGLRHSYASQLVGLGVPLPVVQRLLGHASIRQTMAYAHLAPGAEDAAIERLGEAMRLATIGAVTGASQTKTKRPKGK